MQEEGVMDARSLARLQFENAGREITQSFDVMNSNMALGAGTLAAILTVLGAGELFGLGDGQGGRGFPKLSATSLIVLAAAFPLLVRFFIRSMHAYENLERFNRLQRKGWGFLMGQTSWDAYAAFVQVLWVSWCAPMSSWELFWRHMKYGFAWVFYCCQRSTFLRLRNIRGYRPPAGGGGGNLHRDRHGGCDSVPVPEADRSTTHSRGEAGPS